MSLMNWKSVTRVLATVVVLATLSGCGADADRKLDERKRIVTNTQSNWALREEIREFSWGAATLRNTKTGACFAVVTTPNGVAMQPAEPVNCE